MALQTQVLAVWPHLASLLLSPTLRTPPAGNAINPAMDHGKASFTAEEMDTLRTRLSRHGQAETELPLILLDALLPRQRLQLAIPANDRMHCAMVTAALDTSRTFAMLGIEPGTGQPLRCARASCCHRPLDGGDAPFSLSLSLILSLFVGV
jgi:hypothetical protein